MKEECKYCSGWNDEKAECRGIGMYCATHEQIEEEKSQARIELLNTMFVEDWDIGEDEILYIMVADSSQNREVISELGASEEEIENMKVEPYKWLDISKFAFEYTDAEWWEIDVGFGKGDWKTQGSRKPIATIREVILKTAGMYDGHDPKETDYKLWKSIAEYMDGEAALVVDHYEKKGTYTYIDLKDEEKSKELAYMMEQDSMMGCYIDDRAGFDKAWDNDEYEPGASIVIPAENVILPGQQEGDKQ
ncbi:hypothetical protein [Lacrimispora saccharolytica]|nr:hypothetical protein [Lacrimispora saccharolytica]QRV18493.1 hypothetical protein I6K70_13165 [Lacrimispora saccharolytica]